MPAGSNKSLMSTILNFDDFSGLGRRKIWRLINIFVAEFLGTGILVFLLCSYLNTLSGNIVAIALAGGFAVGTAVMCFAHISGSHINPAISLAAVILGKISLPLAIFYAIAQCSGSFTAYALSRAILPSNENMACCSVPAPGLNEWQVLLSEFLGTFILTLAFASACDKRNHENVDALAAKFGIVLVALIIPLASYSGCSINPSRTFGPALYNWYWKNHWMYWIGPMLGSCCSSFLYRVIFNPEHMEVMPSPPTPDPSTLMLRKNSHKYADDEGA